MGFKELHCNALKTYADSIVNGLTSLAYEAVKIVKKNLGL
jgi:hypothetical protein